MINAYQFQRQEQEQINSTVVDSASLLSLCFDMFTIDDDKVKQDVQAQYLWKQSVPRAVSLSQQALQLRSKQALWFAYNAAALQTIPLNRNEQAVSQLVAQKLLVSYDMWVSPPRLITIEKQNYTALQLAESAEKMFQSAKEIILDPLVFQQIPFNITLIQSLFLMATYLSTTGERYDEAKLLISAMKVFLSREKHLLRANLEAPYLSEITKDLLSKQIQIIMKISGISAGFDFAMNTVRFSQIGVHKNTEKTIKKFLKKFSETFDLKFIKSEKILESFKSKIDAGNRVLQMIKTPLQDATQLEQFLEGTSVMHKGEFEQTEKQFYSFWSFTLFQIQYTITECVYQRCQDPHELHKIKELRWRLANDMTEYCYENRILCSFVSGRIQTVLCYMAETHMEQSTELCSYGASMQLVESCLENIKKDCIVFEEALAKMELARLRDIHNRLKHRIELHEQYYEMSRSGTDDIFMPNVSPEVPDLDFLIDHDFI
jgi:hypothetical protein